MWAFLSEGWKTRGRQYKAEGKGPSARVSTLSLSVFSLRFLLKWAGLTENIRVLSNFFFNFHGTVHLFNVFKHNQQDATLHNCIYYYKCSTCFMRFLRLSSGAQNCTHNIGYLSNFFCFLPLSRVSWNNSLVIAVRSRKSLTNTRYCVYSFELLMMGGGTAWNM